MRTHPIELEIVRSEGERITLKWPVSCLMPGSSCMFAGHVFCSSNTLDGELRKRNVRGEKH